jgi:hypothetical protein
MLLRLSKACLILVLPWLSIAADDSRPACTSRIQGQMWPDAANHDPKLISSLTRCGELLICVRGTWHYHWEAPSVRVDQLGRHAKSKASEPAVCEVEAVAVHPPDASPKHGHE